MNRIKLEIAYDGTDYCGWQLQPGKPTIEAKINDALSNLMKEEIKVIGASRTDSGVHARGNVAVFDTDSLLSPEKICNALNARLPDTIRVMSSSLVDLEFHPRRVNSRKTYEYTILNHRIQDPMQRLYSHHAYYRLDHTLMEEAAGYLVGTHDFKSFCSVRTQALDTVRTIYQLTVTKVGDNIIISITGNGFLYNMVRIIVGTLIKVGRGVYPPARVQEILRGCDRSLAGPTAPSKGLMLISIQYE